MPSPGFYQRMWDGQEVARIFVDLGRLCREKRRRSASPTKSPRPINAGGWRADALQHAVPSREDVLDGVRSSYVKGAADAEGMMVLGMARQLLAGDAIGDVPEDAGQPPIVSDFRQTARRLKIDLDKIRGSDTALDLYRRPAHREMSRFFHRLRFLGVPFAELQRGPDFVTGKDLERVQELWNYHWSPDVESTLIERAALRAEPGRSGGSDAHRAPDRKRAARRGTPRPMWRRRSCWKPAAWDSIVSRPTWYGGRRSL